MADKHPHIVLIGGSSGSITVLQQILAALPQHFTASVIIVIHRLRNVHSDLAAVLSVKHNVFEPEDKEPIIGGRIYLAPQNYHLLIEANRTFGMDYSELVNYSRPSIDVTFFSAAASYGPNATCVVLSGANKDGADGTHAILAKGGHAYVQHPHLSEYTAMPESTLKKNPSAKACTIQEIVQNIQQTII